MFIKKIGKLNLVVLSVLLSCLLLILMSQLSIALNLSHIFLFMLCAISTWTFYKGLQQTKVNQNTILYILFVGVELIIVSWLGRQMEMMSFLYFYFLHSIGIILIIISLCLYYFHIKTYFSKKSLLIMRIGIILYLSSPIFYFVQIFIPSTLSITYFLPFTIFGSLLIMAAIYAKFVKVNSEDHNSNHFYFCRILGILTSVAALVYFFSSFIDDIIVYSCIFSIIVLFTLFDHLFQKRIEYFNKLRIENDWLSIKVKQRTNEITFIKQHDLLTKLPNRHYFNQEVHKSIIESANKKEKFSIISIDLDRFRNINDMFGHSFGDKLLVELAKRIDNALNNNHLVSRQSGDEFFILIKNIENVQDVISMVKQISDSIKEIFVIDQHEIQLSSTIAIAFYPDDGKTAEDLIKNVGIALNEGKKQGNNQTIFFNTQMNEMVKKRITLENYLHRALDNNEFIMYYQPQFDVLSNQIIGMESLIRWNHPQLGMIPPNEFIEIAEESGLIIPIGEWVFKEACRQAYQWNTKYGKVLKIGINVSPRQFSQENLVDFISNTMLNIGISPEYVDIEITESIALSDINYAISKLQKLKELKVHTSLDDFGTGFSSLSYLKDLPIDTLKIAQPFINGIPVDHRDVAIVSAIVDMSKNLYMNVIAEGVESLNQFTFLKEIGCKQVQGYYIGRPVSKYEFEKKYLQERTFKL
jgi:diguanylate cyclase